MSLHPDEVEFMTNAMNAGIMEIQPDGSKWTTQSGGSFISPVKVVQKGCAIHGAESFEDAIRKAMEIDHMFTNNGRLIDQGS